MKKTWIHILAMAVVVFGLVGYAARADQDDVISLRAPMSGFQEVTPKLTDGAGLFTATINGNSMSFKLTYSGLTGNPAVAHLHFGQKGVSGAVFLFLCGGGSQPACPTSPSGTIEGMATGANVVAQTPDQGIAAGDFAAAVRAIKSGETYANMHTAKFPAGEIRGQVKVDDRD